jgi:hypothetical protein
VLTFFDQGIRNISEKTAHGLARLGFGDKLLAEYGHGLDRLQAYLPRWRNEITQEIRTNASGFLPGRKDISLPNNFPDLAIFQLYVNPVTSARTAMNGTEGLAMRDPNPSLPRLAELCEVKFDDWGFRKGILKRFSNLLWPGVVLHLLRRAALEADEKEKAKRIARGDNQTIIAPLQPSPAEAVGVSASLVQRYLNSAKVDRAASAFVNRAIPVASTVIADDSHPLLIRVTSMNEVVSADFVPRYRVIIDPTQLVELASSGFKQDDSITASQLPTSQNSAPTASQTLAIRAANFNPTEPIRIWVPASILRQVHPRLILDWESQKSKSAGARGIGRGKKRVVPENADESEQDESDDEEEEDDDLTKSPTKNPSSQQARETAAASPSKRPAALPATPVATSVVTPSGASSKPVVKIESSQKKDTTQPNPARDEIVVKHERAPGGQSAHPAPVVLQPPPPPYAMLRPTPPFLPPPRQYFNVGLIEAEEPLSDRAFIFTFTDPDDPTYVEMDDKEGSQQGDADADDDVEPVPSLNNQIQPQTAHQPPAPVIHPLHQAESLPTSPCKAQTKRQGKQKQVQPPDSHVRNLPAGSSRPVQPTPSSSSAASTMQPLATQPQSSTTQGPTASQLSTNRAPDPTITSRPGEQGSLSKYDHLFDQLLGIAPGAQRRKPMTAAARKRLRAAIESGSTQEPSGSQPAKKRRTNPPIAASADTQPARSGSTPYAASPARPVPVPQVPRSPAATMSSSQPSSSVRPLAQFPDMPPLDRSASQPSRITLRARAVNRLPDVVVVSSDEEDASGSMVPTTSSLSTSATRRPNAIASGSNTPNPSSRPGDDEFFTDTNAVIRLF